MSAGAAAATLSPEEDRYLSALKLDVDHDTNDPNSTKTKQLLSLFFAIVQNSQRKKWSTMLEKYLIFPWVKPGASVHIPQGLLATPNWQLLVYPLFENLDTPQQQIDESASAEERRLFQMSMSILSLTHWHCFQTRNKIKTDPESIGSTLHESLDLLVEFAGWYEETCMLGRLMLSSFLATIQTHVDSWASDFTHAAWNNLQQVIDVIEYFIFYMPERRPTTSVDNSMLHTPHSSSINFGIHLDADGFCSDLQLVEKIIGIMDQAATRVAKTLNDTNDHDEHKSALAKAGRRCQKQCIDQATYMRKILDYLKQTEEDPKTVSDAVITDLATAACTRDVHAIFFSHNAKKFKKYLQIVVQMVCDLRKGQKYDRSAEIAKDLYSKHPTQGSNRRTTSLEKKPNLATIKARKTDYQDVVPVIRSFRNLPRAPSISTPAGVGPPGTPQTSPRAAAAPASEWGARKPPPPPPGYRKSIVQPGSEINITVGGKESNMGGGTITETATSAGLPPIISFMNKYNCQLLLSRSVDAELFFTRVLFLITFLYLIYVDRRTFQLSIVTCLGLAGYYYYQKQKLSQESSSPPSSKK